jgi:hypothetical protein
MRVRWGGSPRLTIAGYALSAALFVFSAALVGLLFLIEQIFAGEDPPVPREPDPGIRPE